MVGTKEMKRGTDGGQELGRAVLALVFYFRFSRESRAEHRDNLGALTDNGTGKQENLSFLG